MSLLPVEEAQARLLALAAPLSAIPTPLVEATGRWLAAPLAALRNQPWADLSAMDGYAIRFADLPGPWRVTGESAAGGALPAALQPDEAIRIFTGAPVPVGADTIIMQEDVSRQGDTLHLSGDGPAGAGRHIRPGGSDFREGDTVLEAGIVLGAAQVALAAIAGHGAVPVAPRPRIALISTGSELVPPGAPVPSGALPSSNAPMLASLLAPLPCVVTDLGIIRDDLPALTHTMEAAGGYDIVVSTGGASVGDHDLVRPALEAAGGAIDFWKIRMRPGKPLICGRLGGAIFIGLPGNPVSAFVTATLFLLPLVRHLLGAPAPLPGYTKLPLGIAMPAVGERDDFARARIESGVAMPLKGQDSGALLDLSRATALLRRPAGSPPATAGDMVDILTL